MSVAKSNQILLLRHSSSRGSSASSTMKSLTKSVYAAQIHVRISMDTAGGSAQRFEPRRIFDAGDQHCDGDVPDSGRTSEGYSLGHRRMQQPARQMIATVESTQQGVALLDELDCPHIGAADTEIREHARNRR